MKKLVALLLLSSPCFAGTITTYFNPLGTITISSGTATASVPIAVSTHTVALTGSNASVTTPAINTTGSTLLVAALTHFQGSGAVTLSDSLGNTWTALTEANTGTSAATRLYYVSSPTTGASQTFTGSASNMFGSLCILALTGTHASPFDQQNGATALSGTTTLQPGSVTPSQANEIVIAAIGTSNSTTATSIDSGFTISDKSTGGGNNYGTVIAYLIQTTATASNPTWSMPSNGQDSAAVIATFK